MTAQPEFFRGTVLMPVNMKLTCMECGRIFDLTNRDDAIDYYYGHDCEA